MPEAAVDIDGDTRRREHHVRTRVPPSEPNQQVLSKPQSRSMERGADAYLRRRVSPSIGLHHARRRGGRGARIGARLDGDHVGAESYARKSTPWRPWW